MISFFIPLAIAILGHQSDDLVVVVETKTAVVVSQTNTIQRTTIDGAVYESNGVQQESNPAAVQTLVIKVETPYRAVRIKCRTAELNRLDQSTWCLSKPGKHTLDVLSIGLAEGDVVLLEKEIDVELQVIPGPSPDVQPDGEPDSSPPLIGIDGLAVLIVYESGDTLPAAQQAILGSETVRLFLNKEVALVDGTPAWRIFDQDTQFNSPDGIWAQALQRPRSTLPWIVISKADGNSSGYEGPLPENVTQTMNLLRKYEAKK